MRGRDTFWHSSSHAGKLSVCSADMRAKQSGVILHAYVFCGVVFWVKSRSFFGIWVL